MRPLESNLAFLRRAISGCGGRRIFTGRGRSLLLAMLALWAAGWGVASPALANNPNGGNGTGANVTLSNNGDGTWTLANGIVTAKIKIATAQILELSYYGRHVEYGGTAGNNDFYWQGGSGGSDTLTTVVDPASNGGNSALIRLNDYQANNSSSADAYRYFGMFRGSPGIYVAEDMERTASSAGGGADIPSLTCKLTPIFNWLGQDTGRFMPRQTGGDGFIAVPNGPAEVTLLTSGILAGQHECKYDYTGDLGTLHFFGWCTTNQTQNYGLWMIHPSREYFTSGPKHCEIIGQSQMLNCTFTSPHFGFSCDLNFTNGEPWSKVCGPVFLYFNQVPQGTANPQFPLYADALAQTTAETGAWPYNWFTNNPNYIPAAGRGAVTGQIIIADSGNPNASPANLWVGVAQQPPSSLSPATADFQNYGKNFQYWTKTDNNGNFTIPNVIAGTNYTLFAFGPGSPDQFQSQPLAGAALNCTVDTPAAPFAVTVNGGQTNYLGVVTWTPTRVGATVFEIGVPDRDTTEFRHGQDYWHGDRGSATNWPINWAPWMDYGLDFPSGLNFTNGVSRWSADWDYAQPTLLDPVTGNLNGTVQNIYFNLPATPGSSSQASIYFGIAASYQGAVVVQVNGNNVAGANGFWPPFSDTGTGNDAMIRMHSHGIFGDARFNFAGNLLHQGQNVIMLTMRKGGYFANSTLYDYIRLELSDYVPPTPASLMAIAGNGKVVLNWPASSGATRYNVLRSTVSGGGYTAIATNVIGPVVGSDVPDATYTDNSVVNGTTYYYVVSAANPNGSSANSVQAGATPSASTPGAPSAPGNLTVTPGDTRAALTWNAVSGAATYTIKRTVLTYGAVVTQPDGSIPTNVVNGFVTATNYTDTGLQNNVAYAYTVSAANANGQSADSAPASVTPAPAPLAAPGGLLATVSVNNVTLAWNPVVNAEDYFVSRATSAGGPYTTLNSYPSGTTGYYDGGLAYNTTYYYQVAAANLGGIGTNALAAIITTPAAPAPVVAAGGSNQVSLKWGVPTGGATSYTILRGAVSGGETNAIFTTTNTSFADLTAQNGTNYFYVVVANGPGGAGPWSAEVSATPAASVAGALAHRYSFSETSGTTVADAVGGAAWNGTLPNGGTLGGGQARLLASGSQYVRLPANILSNYTAVTIDLWATFPGTLPSACFLFGFGNVSGSSGYNYIFCQPKNGRIAITPSNYAGEQNTLPNPSGDWSGLTNLHVTAVFNPPGGGLALYTNGVLVAVTNPVTVAMSSVNDLFSYIGRSLYSGDSYFDFNLDEFRIYNGALSAGQITAGDLLGANQILTSVPPAPAGLAAAGGFEQASLSWNVASNASGFATSYAVKRANVSGGPYTVVAEVTGTNFTDTALNDGTTYFYVVTALNAVAASANSAEASATTTTSANSAMWDGGGVTVNWSEAANWVGDLALTNGFKVTSLILAGTTNTGAAAVPLNNDLAGGTMTNLNFAFNAGSFVIGGNTLTNVGGIYDYAAAPQTINAGLVLAAGSPNVVNVVAGSLALGGKISAAGGLTSSGAGTLILNGANAIGGPATVNAGTLIVSNNAVISVTNALTVGNSAANAVFAVGGGSVTASNVFLGNASGAVAAIYQTGGTMNQGASTSSDNVALGNVAGAFGYYYAGGGALTTSGLAVGGENYAGGFGPAGNGLMDINGGTVNDTGWLVLSRGSGTEAGVLNIFSGTLNYAGGGLVCNWGTNQTAIVNVLGGTVANPGATGVGVWLGGTNSTGILNLNGGSLAANAIGGPGGQLNFNGGTLKASAANPNFIAVSTGAGIYANGATIDNGGFNLAITQPLQSPAGAGVAGIGSLTGGAGYIAPPIVTIAPGSGDTTGSGATAIAQIDSSAGSPTSGQVTNVLITCPGAKYTAAPIFNVSGGGASTPATITGATPVANPGGGFASTGSGTLSLCATENYGGATAVNGGTLKLSTAPVLFMSFETVSGSTVINEGSGGPALNGTLSGTASVVAGSGINGGKALSIPSGAANAAYVLVNNPVVALTGANPWTVALWVKTTTAGGVYAYQGSGGWASGNTTFYLNQGNASGFGAKAGGVSYGQGWETGTTTLNDGNWHFVVMTCNGGSKAMYVDGNVDAITSNWAANTGAGGQFWIGGSADTGDKTAGLGGLIDSVYVYNYALSQAQVQSLYAGTMVAPPVLPATSPVSMASGATLNAGAVSQTVSSLSGPAGGKLILSDTTNSTATFTVSNANNSVFAGVISGAGWLAKAGAGSLTLAGANTYTGATMVVSGALIASNASGSATGNGSVTVQNGGTLAGTGAIAGAVTVNSGGVVSPGNPFGTLTISNTLALDSGGTLVVPIQHSPLTNGVVKTTGTLTRAGTLLVTNLGGALGYNDSFKLLNAAGYSGSFASIILPSLPAGLGWNTNSLASSGIVSVTATTALTPTNVLFAVSNATLALSWPADHLGWILQQQTNSLNSGLGTNWLDVPGTDGITATNISVNPASPSVFYRLRRPW